MYEMALIIEASISDQRLDLAIQYLQNIFVEKSSNVERPASIVFW